MSDYSNFDDMIEGEDDGTMKHIIGMMLHAPCVNGIELELTEAMDLASELILRQMGADAASVRFIEALEEGETEPEPEVNPPLESEIMVAQIQDEKIREWKDRIALARSLGPQGEDGGRGAYIRACAKNGMTPGESTAQLLAMLKPYHPEWS